MRFLWRELPISRAFFYISLGFPSKQGLLKKNKFHLPLKASVKEHPLNGFQQGPYGERCPVSSAFLYISFKVPSKGAPLQVPLAELP